MRFGACAGRVGRGGKDFVIGPMSAGKFGTDESRETLDVIEETDCVRKSSSGADCCRASRLISVGRGLRLIVGGAV